MEKIRMPRIRLSKEFTYDLRLLADKIAHGKVEPMQSWIDFEELINKHYGDKADRLALYTSFTLYLQLFTFNRLMIIIRFLEQASKEAKRGS